MAGTIRKTTGALLLALLASAGVAAAAAPDASFSVGATAAAGSPVVFTDTSAGAPTSWKWDFGDGSVSTSESPTHVYAAAGFYTVRLTAGNGAGQSAAVQQIEVSPEDTLRLIASHPFDVTLSASDPSTGRTGAGKAVPQNDLFGYFTLPDLVPTSGPSIPEVFIKILDATSIGQNYWVFWGGLTSLDYALSVRETATGATKTYHNPATLSPDCLGADISGFEGAGSATGTPTAPAPTRSHTPTRTPTPTVPGATATPTPTGSPAPSPTPTSTPTPAIVPTVTPTPTPTPGGAVVIKLRAIDWQWDFVMGPNTSTTKPYPGINTITLQKGQTYEFHIYNDGPVLDPPLPPHSFSGIAALGLNGGELDTGGPELVQTITPTVTGDFPYLCTFSDCGTGANQHDAMHGVIRVAP